MADMFADKLVKKCINNIILHRDTLPDDIVVWKSLTRMMFKNFEAWKVWKLITTASEEASDEYWFEHKYPKGFFKETWEFPKKKSVIKLNSKTKRVKKLINDNIKITDVAKSYGLKLKGKGNMTLCPFHIDTQASLGFDDKKNIFHCFGCNVKGDIIEFKRRMKKWEKGMKPQKNF